MWDALLWAYLACACLLIVHEIDSAYWKEWELFRLPGGIGFFLVLHVPLVLLLLWGGAMIQARHAAGPWVALAAGLGGLLAFGLHTVLLRLGKPQFGTAASRLLLAANLAAAAALLAVLALGLPWAA